MKKQTIGYFYRKRSETPLKAFSFYTHYNLYKTVEECKKEIEDDKKSGNIGRASKPIIIKVVFEEQE